MRSASGFGSRPHRFAGLLALLLVSLAIQSFDVLPSTKGSLSNVIRAVLGVAILVVVFDRTRERAAMATILVLTIAFVAGRAVSGASFDYALSFAIHALMALFLWAAVWVILRELFRRPAVGAENVLGAICGYLIAGDAWAAVNALTYVAMPGAYSVNPGVSSLLVDWQGRVALFSYYSFAQMMTIGYADVTPVRAPATTLSLFGALFGLFYTAVVVSQFVGMAQSTRSEAP